MFVRNGAVTPGPSRECRDDQNLRDNRVTVQCRRARVQSVTVPSSQVSRECRSPELKCPKRGLGGLLGGICSEFAWNLGSVLARRIFSGF